MSAARQPRPETVRAEARRDERTPDLVRPVALPAAVVAVLGAGAWALGLAVDAEAALHAWLAAFFFGLTVALGTLCMLMIAHAVGSKWFVAVRRPAEAAAATIPLFVLLFLPVLFGVQLLYPWLPPLDELPRHLRELVHKKDAYLNLPFFVLRSALYLALWSAVAWMLRRWSLRQDDPEREAGGRPVLLSGLGLFGFAFALHFASVDWVMSLDPEWTSSLFGGYAFAGTMVGGLALLVLLVRNLERSGHLRGVVTPAHYYALGRLLLVFVVFWAYMFYAQGYLVWIADLPAEAKWYNARWDGGWSWITWSLMLGHFALPFFALLSRKLKRTPKALAAVAAYLLVIHWVDVFWLVLPALELEEPATALSRALATSWMQLAALAAVVGAFTAAGAWLLSGHPALPRNDPRLEAAMEYDPE